MTNITKKAVLENLEEVRKYIAEADSAKEEKKKVCIEIKNRFTSEIKFTSEKSTIKEACQDNRANLSGADLSGADFMNAKFYGKGGSTKIKKSQVGYFFKALGVVVKE